VTVADSNSWLFRSDGLDDEQLMGIVAAKRRGDPVATAAEEAASIRGGRPSGIEILEHAKSAGIEGAIVVDVTAADGTESLVERALSLGYRVVLANKKILAGPWSSAREYFSDPRIRYESTVGGGQPIIATLRYLLDVNDPIYQIEGQLSGTLGFICARLDQGAAFSQAIGEARQQGFTEPDPRDDLGGQDVRRKVLILGRMVGWPLEPDDVEVESLYPSEMSALSTNEFLAEASSLDVDMRQRVEAARAEGNVLRYVARLSSEDGSIGLRALPASSPLAHLKYVSFRTARYDDEPLLIGGKGAGVEMTAAGVLGDMIGLVRETVGGSA